MRSIFLINSFFYFVFELLYLIGLSDKKLILPFFFVALYLAGKLVTLLVAFSSILFFKSGISLSSFL